MRPDSEGFLFPTVDAYECTDCALCDRICPIPKEKDPATRTKGDPLEVLAGWHLDPEIRRQSSSGGVFTALADAIFAQGGVVVGAAFDEKLVVKHIIIEDPADLHRLRGSKYVQSEIAPEVYHAIRDHLKVGRVVLFTGVPCQVAGLKDFLRKPYTNLYTVDLICHGVPSPLFWEKYLDHCRIDSARPTQVSFRDKATGWKRFSVRRTYPDGTTRSADLHHDLYMQAFLKNLNLRESCYRCQFCSTARQGDLTIADFWGIGCKYPSFDDADQGTSLLLRNTTQKNGIIEQADIVLFTRPADLSIAIPGNPALVRPHNRPAKRSSFYKFVSNHTLAAAAQRFRLKPRRLLRLLQSAKHQLVVNIPRPLRAQLKALRNRLAPHTTR